MKRVVSRVRYPVMREGADTNLLLTLLSFAVSVGGTRLFLELTGYPQLGGGQYHIAHVLWGGLFLFAAALLPLIFTNRWVYKLGAVSAGIGVGLFIDEVGKFITASNDYFHPAAAPIIYAFFLLTVLVYLRVRKPPRRSARTELYRALDALEELLDQDLDHEERAALLERLEFVASQDEEGDLAGLASNLKGYLESDSLHIAPTTVSRWERWLDRIRAWEDRHFPLPRLMPVLAGALLGLAIIGLYGVYASLVPDLAAVRLRDIVLAGRLDSSAQQAWYVARLMLQSVSGLMLLAAVIALVIGRDEAGVAIGVFGLLLVLTTVNLIVFYFNQFSTILKATLELGVLLALLRYRARLKERAESG
ncbi:MAG: hypothetical protein ACLFWD_10990 [Anaerolineales bacterium]